MLVSMNELLVAPGEYGSAVSTGGFRRMAFRYDADHGGQIQRRRANHNTTPGSFSTLRRVRLEE